MGITLKQEEGMWLGRIALVVGLCVGLLSLTGCGWPFPKPVAPKPEVQRIVSQTVSAAEGGAIVVTEEMSTTLAGLELVIPPGALQTDQEITVGEVISGLPPHPEGHVSLGYQFSLEPAGLSFKTPSLIRIAFPVETWQMWRNLVAPEDVMLMKYDENSRKWVRLPAQIDVAGVLTATIDGFSFFDAVLFWRPRNPASSEKILQQALRWAPAGSTRRQVELRLHEQLFVDHSQPAIFISDVTFAHKIGALLLAEAMWSRLSEGNFYAAASYAEVVLETLPKEVLTEFIKKVIGLPSLGIAVTTAKLIIETAVKYFLKVMTTAAFNNQLKAYLSWRGWFFEGGTWTYIKDRGRDHNAVIGDQDITTEDGWFYRGQRSDGTWRTIIYHRPPGGDPKELFNLGNMLCDLLHKVVHERKWVWYVGRELNGLEADRAWLERAFRGWNKPPEVSIAGPGQVVPIGKEVTLQGSARDLEDDPMVWRWEQTDGPPVELRYAWSLSPSFTPTRPGIYGFKLDVWDMLVENRTTATVTVTVSGDSEGVPPVCMVTVQPGESIQKAIDRALEGTVICLGEGTWKENLVIKKGLTLQGLGPEKSIIERLKEDEPVIRILSEKEIEVTIRGLTITKGSCGLLLVGKVKATILRNTFSGNALGILIEGSAQATIRKNTFSGSVTDIFMGRLAQATIWENTLSGSEYNNIVMCDSAQATIKGNTFLENKASGIYMCESAQATIWENTFSGNRSGIVMGGLAQATIRENIFSGNAFGITMCDSAQATIEGNKITDNKGYGVALYQRPCYDTVSKFEGAVQGRKNEISRNKKGNICPSPELDFLMTEEGGCHGPRCPKVTGFSTIWVTFILKKFVSIERQKVTHTYTLPNGVSEQAYEARLYVFDDEGNIGEDAVQIYVWRPSPEE